MNYYERHIGDYIRDTVSLSMMEDGAYNRLMDQYYQTERPLPDDRKMLYRLARASTAAERKAVDFVIESFFERTADGLVQKRIEAEISRFQEKQRKAKASADARWNKSRRDANASSKHHATDMRTHSEGNAHQTPDTSNNSLSPAHDERLDLPGLSDHHTADWKPDHNRLAAELLRQGIPMPGPDSLAKSLHRFNAHFEGKSLTVNLRYAKLAAWLEGDHRREQTQRPQVTGQHASGSPQPARRPTPVELAIEANRQYLRDHGLDPDGDPVRG